MKLLLSILTLALLIVFPAGIPASAEVLGESGTPTNTPTTTLVNFPVGTGGADVIPHQVVRTNSDHLYIIVNQQSSAVLRVYRTTNTGLPEGTADFAAPVQLTETSNPISVDAAYDGGNIVHVLINTKNGHIKDYPFDVSTNTFKSPIILATDGGTVPSGLYVGTSGISGMIDLSGNLHIAYWKNGNHILHRSYTYDSSSNVLTPLDSFFQVDTAGGANHPVLAISPAGNSLTIAWVSQADNPTKIRARTRASDGTWGSVESASTASVWTSSDNGINIDQGPSLIIDTSGERHLTYIQSFDPTSGDYGRIHYVTNTSAGWVDQALNAFSHDPALAINNAGEIYIIGHGHPKNVSCLSVSDMCTIKKNSNGTWANPQLFALHPSGSSFDSSPSVKWSVVGFNRPETIEFIFFKTPYDNPTVYYGRIQSSNGPINTPTNTPTPNNTPTDTPEPSCTPTNTLEPTTTPTDTPQPRSTPTNTLEPTNTPTNTPEPNNIPTDTPEPSSTPTNTLEPTNTPTDTPKPSSTPTNTSEPSNTPTATSEPSSTPTNTLEPTNTPTDTPKPSNTPTYTPLPSSTPTNTLLPSSTPTNTPLPTNRKTLRSLAVPDGWILETSESSNKGSARNNTAATFYLGDDAQDKQYLSILSFTTKDLPDKAVITKVTLMVKKQGILGGGNPVNTFQGFLVDVKKGFFGSTAGLQASDFQASGSNSYGPFKPALTSGWYTIDLTPAKDYINMLSTNGGVTQIRLRFKLDDNNNAKANYLSLFSGDATAASRPQLIIQYRLP